MMLLLVYLGIKNLLLKFETKNELTNIKEILSKPLYDKEQNEVKGYAFPKGACNETNKYMIVNDQFEGFQIAGVILFVFTN